MLPHPTLVRAAAALQPLARPFLPRHVRDLVPRNGHAFARLPRVTEPPSGVEVKGTAALLAGCAQDRWFHQVNLATIRVLARRGWRVTVPRSQACCGALAAHNGRLGVARRLATRAKHAFEGADVVVVNAAGCSAHMTTYEELAPGTGLPVRDLMEVLAAHGVKASFFLAIQAQPGLTGIRQRNRASAATPELLRGVSDSKGRWPWFKRILGFRALAFPMPQDTVDDVRICNKRDDAHAAAARAQNRIRFENLLNQPGPRAAGFPGGI